MQELLIREFSKPTLTEIKKSRLKDTEYDERNLDVILTITVSELYCL
jgi:hypothetical protein